MSATITLPSALQSRLSAVRRRAHLLRAARGVGWVVLVLGLSGAAALLADYAFDLPAVVRQGILPAWLGVGALLLLVGVIVPLFRRIDAAALAAVIEEKYPDLGERLTSAVELSKVPPEGHGSPVLIALLMDETERHTSSLDFRPAVPARRTGAVAALAAVVVLLVAAPALVWPATYGELARRFFRPWDVPPVVAPYTIDVSPGDTIAARGRDLTLSARLTPRDEQVTLPVGATLIYTDAGGKETRRTMERAAEGEFTLALKVPGDVLYRIEAGEVVSETYRIAAVTPVELAADSPAVMVTPPAYARKVRDEETFHGLVDLSPLRHSRVRFDFQFTRPAVAARIEWTSANGVTDNALTLSEDRLAASFTLEAVADGKYRVVLEAEHGIRTELQGGTVQVRPDLPPVVVKIAGEQGLKAVLPYDRVPMHVEASDDVAVAGVELEYRVNDKEAVRQPLELQGADTPSAITRGALELTGKVKEDDRVHYRFRVSDNLPKEYQGPHVVIYPADRWLTLQVMRKGDPLRQKEILTQRDDINRRLESIKQALLQERRGVYKVQQETRDRAILSPEHTEQVKRLQQENRDSEKALRELARVADDADALRPVADLARDVADREMHAGQKALEQAPREASPPLRGQKLAEADRQLESGVKRLDELKKTNDRLAQERLDRAKLEELADREKRLAEEAAELAAKHPVLDPSAKPQAEKVRRDQAEVAAELDRLSQQSEPLRQALDEVRADEARRMAERARELAKAQRELSRAEAQAERQRDIDRLAELARKQQALAEAEAKLAAQTRPAVETARSRPLQPEQAQRAAEALKRGDAAEAVRRQDQAAGDLERLARDFERAVKVSADPKEAARQLAQAEKDLRQRVREEAAKKDDRRPAAERMKPLQAEQSAIRQAAQRLSVPPAHVEAKRLKRQIAERAAEAADAMQKQDAGRAQAKMDEAQNLLNRLADVLPNLEQRRQQARQEAERLRRRQDEIARQIEAIKKDDPAAERRIAEAARRQAEVAETLSKMDAPNQEQRRERTAEAATRALADLLDARRDDVPASQQEAKRQLERLDQALRGEKPADERARDLAHKQRQLNDEAARAAADPKPTPRQQQEIQRKQREIADQTANLPSAEAPQRQREAAQATRQAADAPTPERREEAARKLDDLARQMAGEESDAARAQRLARRQAEEAAEAMRRGDKAATPEAQRRQQEIGREIQAIRGGDEAREEKRRASEALARAEQAPPREQARTRRQAADALHDLADRLAGRNDPAAKANDLARQQRELAREASQTDPKQAAGRQAELKRQLDRLDSRDAPQAAKEASETMTEAARALEGAKSPAEAKETLARAAEATEKLAEQLGKAQAAKNPGEPSGRTISAKRAAVSPRQAAQQMAGQQRQLAQASQEAQRGGAEAGRKALPKIAEQQSQLNRQASQLPAAGAQRGLEQARAAMNRAEKALARSDAAAARQEQNEAANALERLARQLPDELPQTARRESSDTPDATPRGLPSKEQSEEARQLARQQRELRDAVQRAAQAARPGRPAGESAKQQGLQQQAADLARQLGRMAAEARSSWPMQSALQRATGSARQAEQAMRQASEQGRQGASAPQHQSQERAAQMLDQAARDASQASQQTRPASAQAAAPKSASEASGKTGEAVAQAREKMSQAGSQLSQGKTSQAQAAMKQAAQALAQAAQPKPGPPQQTAGGGRLPGGLPDLRAYGLPKTLDAKGWGELPGELRTKIVQDMKARYGEDYARAIKYYFEQIADTKKD